MTDDIVYSHEVGLRKPDPAIYALAAARLGVAPYEVLFLDDVSANVGAARRRAGTPCSTSARRPPIRELEAIIAAEQLG